jgi:hypothetical protein
MHVSSLPICTTECQMPPLRKSFKVVASSLAKVTQRRTSASKGLEGSTISKGVGSSVGHGCASEKASGPSDLHSFPFSVSTLS